MTDYSFKAKLQEKKKLTHFFNNKVGRSKIESIYKMLIYVNDFHSLDFT